MLMETEEGLAGDATVTLPPVPSKKKEDVDKAVVTDTMRKQPSRLLQIEWLGQTVASLCWIVSVLVYGISSAGDWLQLAAASSWFVANIAAVRGEED